MVWVWIIASIAVVSILSLIGIFTVSLNKGLLKKLIDLFVAFAAGALLGAAFFDLLPEAVDELHKMAFVFVVIGLIAFMLLEKLIHWHHCHDLSCKHKNYGYMVLAGDAFHNFLDGAIIATAFLTNPAVGFSSTLAIIFHEIPQEIGDFAILLKSGFSKRKALVYNFLSALTAFIGAGLVFFAANLFQGLHSIILPFAAGGFIYIATADLIPEIHKEQKPGKFFFQIILLSLGIALMYFISSTHVH